MRLRSVLSKYEFPKEEGKGVRRKSMDELEMKGSESGSASSSRSQSVSSNEEISRRGSGCLERVVEEDEDGVGLHELESF